MPAVNFYFQVHQPFRLKPFSFLEIGKNPDYFESQRFETNNQEIFNKVAQKCYYPASRLLLQMLYDNPGLKLSFSFSGVFLDQAEVYQPQLLEIFKEMVKTGRTEILAETYYHSLAFLFSKQEFELQVRKHRHRIKKIFNYTPTTFRNTELIYSNELGLELEKMGYNAVLTEGADRVLGWRNPNFLYYPHLKHGKYLVENFRPKGFKESLENDKNITTTKPHLRYAFSGKAEDLSNQIEFDLAQIEKDLHEPKIKLFLKNYRLSDDIAFRFSQKTWNEFPLTAQKFTGWVNQINGEGEIVNLFMDYETFGEHQWQETGIFDFVKYLPHQILKHPDNYFTTPSEATKELHVKDFVDVPQYISWADTERDLSAWLSNDLQHEALSKIYDLETKVKKSGDNELIEDWRKLQTSDHFYYMCTKYWNDGDVHKYFSPYNSPYEAYIYFFNAVHDLELRLG